MWRAHLADGRVVDHDGDNTPQHFLDLIVRFEVFEPGGSRLALIEPGPGERVIWRWVRENNGFEQRTVGVKVGLLDRESGGLDVNELTPEGWHKTTDVVLTPQELA